jgi:hypothetical protein
MLSNNRNTMAIRGLSFSVSHRTSWGILPFSRFARRAVVGRAPSLLLYLAPQRTTLGSDCLLLLDVTSEPEKRLYQCLFVCLLNQEPSASVLHIVLDVVH